VLAAAAVISLQYHARIATYRSPPLLPNHQSVVCQGTGSFCLPLPSLAPTWNQRGIEQEQNSRRFDYSSSVSPLSSLLHLIDIVASALPTYYYKLPLWSRGTRGNKQTR
jgi:hypothetical protein